MAKEMSATLSTDVIRAAAGDRVNIGALFNQPVYIAIYEVGEVQGWKCIERFREKVRTLDCNVVVHNDTKLFDIVANPDDIADIEDPKHNVEVAFKVVVTGEEPQPTPEPTPTPTPTPEPDEKELGGFLFKYGILSDTHICEGNNNTSNDWWDESDFKACMDILAADPDVKFVESCGDILESESPAEATPEFDWDIFYNLYNEPYWQVAGLRFFTPLGNHDFWGMYESRFGDKIMDGRFTDENSIVGHNEGVNNRIGKLSISGQGINGIVPGRGRIVFDTNSGEVPTSGQDDMNFFAFDAYVEMYAEAAGYHGSVAPTENRLSDEAIRLTREYVFNHWNEYKDKISGYYNGYLGMRNVYSKQSFWTKKGNHVFVNLSLDYGDDIWPVNNVWHDRMIRARQIINLDERDPFIRRMVEYVADTDYGKNDEPYNFRYYSPNALIWLKEIIENNQDKCIHIFTHLPLPHRVGNDDPFNCSLPKDGGYSYARINKDGIVNAQGINEGSNTVTGIEFWFLNKLGNQYKNVIFYSGHSHISYENSYHFDNRDYPIVQPSGSAFAYTKSSTTPLEGSGAWFVNVPSTSKPRYIEGGSSSRMYKDAEMTFVEVYDNGVKIKGYKIVKDGKNVYDPDNPLVEKTIILK